MRTIRVIFGFVLIVAIAIPSLLGVIWATGITHAVIQPQYIHDVPQKVIRLLPGTIEQAFALMQSPKSMKDPEAKIWLKAMKEVQPQPSELLKQIGIFRWLEKQVAAASEDLGKMIAGKIPPKDIVLDNQSLKKALTHPALLSYIRKVFQQLPPCTDLQKARLQAEFRLGTRKKLPRCNPGVESIAQIQALLQREAAKIPEKQVILLKKDLPVAIESLRISGKLLWFLFLIPGLLFLLFAWIASAHSKGFLRWIGIPVFLTSLVPLAFSAVFRDFSSLISTFDSSHWKQILSEEGIVWTPELQALLVKNVTPVLEYAVSPVMQSVFRVSLTCVIVGVVFILLSFVATGRATRVVHVSS